MLHTLGVCGFVAVRGLILSVESIPLAWGPTNVVIRGGNLNNGGNDGPFYLNLNNAFSNSNWNYGSRLETVDFQAAESLPMA